MAEKEKPAQRVKLSGPILPMSTGARPQTPAKVIAAAYLACTGGSSAQKARNKKPTGEGGFDAVFPAVRVPKYPSF
jgi:hypothetical protein